MMTPANAAMAGFLVGLMVGYLLARRRFMRLLRQLFETVDAAHFLEDIGTIRR